MVHIFEIAALLLVVFFQVKYYRAAKQKFSTLKNVFEAANYRLAKRIGGVWRDPESQGQISVNFEGDQYCSEGDQIIVAGSESSDEFNGITGEINEFFLNNEGASADFHLMKDIVERKCDRIEGEAEDVIPLPLYCGLAGTILGIIFGLGGIWASDGGFSGFVENPGDSIGYLLGGIALAMIVSLLGLILTTLLSTTHTKARTKLSEGKNEFYNWLQREFMANMASDLPSAIHSLNQSLGGFNATLGENVLRMERVFQKATSSLDQQRQLIEAIRSLDVAKMAKYNMNVLEKFETSINHIDQFNNVFETLRTAAEHIEDHQQIIKNNTKASAGIKDSFDKFADMLDEHIEEASAKFGAVLVKQQESVMNAVEKNSDQINKSLEDGHNELLKAFETYVSLAKDLQQVPKMKEELAKLNQHMEKQGQLLERQIKVLSQRNAATTTGKSSHTGSESKGESKSVVVTAASAQPVWQRYVTWVLMALIAAGVIFVGVTNVMMMNETTASNAAVNSTLVDTTAERTSPAPTATSSQKAAQPNGNVPAAQQNAASASDAFQGAATPAAANPAKGAPSAASPQQAGTSKQGAAVSKGKTSKSAQRKSAQKR